jgi:hypothetical protein
MRKNAAGQSRKLSCGHREAKRREHGLLDPFDVARRQDVNAGSLLGELSLEVAERLSSRQAAGLRGPATDTV